MPVGPGARRLLDQPMPPHRYQPQPVAPRRQGRTVAVVVAAVLAAAGLVTAAVLVGRQFVVVPEPDPPEPVAQRILAGHTEGVSAIATGRLGDLPVAVTGSNDDTSRTWDLAVVAAS
jgi:hypothetical protein